MITGKEKTHQISLRLAVILAFAAVAIFIVATPLNQYLAQQQEKRIVLANLEETTIRVTELERELELWKDESYIQSQARERLGYVMPGQTLYSVTDPDAGTASEQLAQRAEEVNRLRRESTPFYVTMWDSISVAGQVGDFENPSEVPVIDAPATPGSTEGDEADEGTPAEPEGAEDTDDAGPAVPADSVQDTGETSNE